MPLVLSNLNSNSSLNVSTNAAVSIHDDIVTSLGSQQNYSCRSGQRTTSIAPPLEVRAVNNKADLRLYLYHGIAPDPSLMSMRLLTRYFGSCFMLVPPTLVASVLDTLLRLAWWTQVSFERIPTDSSGGLLCPYVSKGVTPP